MRGKQDLPPRAVLLTCDDDLRNTLTEMVPVLQEHGLSCLFFVTGASLREVPTMLWYEQLYLMFLATKKHIVNLDAVRHGFRAEDQNEKRRLWWNLVKHLSRYEADASGELLEEVRVQLGLGDDWGVADSFRSFTPPLPDAECDRTEALVRPAWAWARTP